MGTKIFAAGGPAWTAAELTPCILLDSIGEIVVEGTGIEVLMIGADVGFPVVLSPVFIVPCVAGAWVLGLGRL